MREPAPRPCANPVCPLPAPRQAVRCRGCAVYRWRHGVERPARLAQGVPTYCSACGPPQHATARRLCVRHYKRWWRARLRAEAG